MMKWIRKAHLYVGLLCAPLVIFFATTGAYQIMFPDRSKFGEAEGFWARLRTVHVDGIYPSTEIEKYSPDLFHGLAIFMALALILSAVLGIFMAFRFSKNKKPVWLILILGIALPVIFLALGHRG
jgi:hypothetical protein